MELPRCCSTVCCSCVFELHCEGGCLFAWLQGQDSDPGAIVGIHCLVKGHVFSCTQPLMYRLDSGLSGWRTKCDKCLIQPRHVIQRKPWLKASQVHVLQTTGIQTTWVFFLVGYQSSYRTAHPIAPSVCWPQSSHCLSSLCRTAFQKVSCVWKVCASVYLKAVMSLPQ